MTPSFTDCSVGAVPVVLFAYARPEHLRQVLSCLRENQVPLIYAFSDGPRTPEKAPQVAQVREILHAIDWCEISLVEREENWGLGRSILAGVTQVLQNHESCIVVEDDLICVPGTYQYLTAALDHYRTDSRVMSVGGWTHPLLTPSDVTEHPYFDGRAECWIWGTWRRAWMGMQDDAKTLMARCRSAGMDVYRYGTDLPDMAETELVRNIWAVRWLYWHLLNRGLCLRPPWSMVEHIGFDPNATNTQEASWLQQPDALKACPPLPIQWPAPLENPQCAKLHRTMCGTRPSLPTRLYRRTRRAVGHTLRRLNLR
jgi:hypothetical protein